MTLAYPYALDFLANCLKGPVVPLNLRRFDETSGGGDGRRWSAQLATPLWECSYDLYSHLREKSRELNAKIFALDGMNKSFLWTDPYYEGPARGTAGLENVAVASIRADRGAVGLTGLPSGFGVTAGDYVTIEYSNARVYFGIFAESASSNGTAQRELRPYLPFGVNIGAKVTLVRPYFKAIVEKYTPFASFQGVWGQDASISILQKI